MITTRKPSRPAALVLGALLTLVCALTLLPRAMSPAAAAPADDDPDPAEITLEHVAPDYLDEDEDLTLAGTITNHGDTPLSNVTVWWRMLTHVPSDEGLEQWLREEDEAEPLTLARHDLEDEIKAGSSAPYEMVIPAEDSPFDYGSAWGPRGIEMVVSAVDEDGEQVRAHVRSTIIWYPSDESNAAPLTVAAPVTPTAAEWAAALNEGVSVAETSGPRLEGILGHLHEHAVTWGVDAALLDEVPPTRLEPFLLAAPGEEPAEQGEGTAVSDPLQWEPAAKSGELAEKIRAATGDRDVLSLGWARPDWEALLRAGADGEDLRERNTDRANTLLHEAGLSPADGVIWTFTGLDSGSISRLDERTDTVLIPATEAGANFVPPTAGHLTVRSPEAGLTDLLLARTEPRELLARTLIEAQEESTSLLVTLPPELTAEQAENVAENLQVLKNAPWLELSPLTAPTPGRGVAGGLPPLSSNLTSSDVGALADSLARADSLASLTEAPERVGALFQTAAFLAGSEVWREDPSQQQELLAEVEDASGAQFLTIERPSTVNLISQGGDLPVSVENESPLPLHPTVLVQPEDARLLAEEPVTASLEPGQSTTVRVPITAVANGNVSATIRLVNDEGEDVAAAQNFTVRVRADWETTGTAVLAGVIAVGFLFGLFRNIRSGRRARRQNG